MESSSRNSQSSEFREVLLDYLGTTSGLKGRMVGTDKIQIEQVSDGKSISFLLNDLEEVLTREDSEKNAFIQINFKSKSKILITESLIGFKPVPQVGLDSERLPKVVTTPDLVSVFEAVEEAIGSEDAEIEEVEVLKKVFFSILRGGEAVGFDLSTEKEWLRCLSNNKASA